MNHLCQNRFIFLLAALTVSVWLILGAGTPCNAQEMKFDAGQIEFFERKVRPLLVDNCHACHSLSAEKNQGGLLLDSRAAILKGGDSGEAIVPGKPHGSLLIGAVKYEDYEMPPKGQLPEDQIAILEKWVEMGAPWPSESANAGLALEEFDLEARRKEHWVWQPIVKHPHPTVDDLRWSGTSIDQFIGAKLSAKQLQPAERAKPLAIARRLHMDLIGLPPTPDELAELQSDMTKNPDQAIEKLVDRLLASVHFGERWGRHWLDLSRYAESSGHEFDNDIPNAFQYRDYVIRALNADIPYDQLIREHIAGDLLDAPRLHPKKNFNESILGTGFWFLGESSHSPVDIRKDESDRFDNMIDVATKSFLGVTVSCARCHDHKFDAISTADYYSLTGFLHSSDYRQVRFESIEQNRKVAAKLNKVNRRYQDEILRLLKEQEIEPPAQNTELTDQHIVFDFATLPQTQFLQDGFIFGDQALTDGRPYFLSADDSLELGFAADGAAINDPFWNRLESISQGGVLDKNKLSEIPKSGRTLRTPTFELEDGILNCFVAGQGHIIACVDSHRTVFGPLHGKTIKAFEAGSQHNWVQLDLKRYLNHRLHLEFVPAIDQQISVRFVAQGLDQDEQKKLSQKIRKYKRESLAFVERAESAISDNENGIAEAIKKWQAERKQLSEQLTLSSRLAPAMMDGIGEEANVYIRGNASKLGPIEPRHFLTAVDGGQPMVIEQGSGRLQLAERINNPDNPLTSRVIVNRIWHHLMGRGLVPTTDDFGVLGERPTHPELLDHLAWEFVADGQSIKRMIKRIVLSQTYQMASRPVSKSLAADPKNLLWHHRPPKRLEGEAIRDTLLAISGKLDPTQEGPSVPIHLTKFMEGRGRPKVNGPLDGDGRRSIYVSVRRNFLSPFMTTFDTPVPFSTMGRRNVSNVPAQALVLMNDPFVAEQAKLWAERALAAEEDSRQRIEWMYQSAFGRLPTTDEARLSLEFVGDGTDVKTWTNFAHSLINTKEFVFLR